MSPHETKISASPLALTPTRRWNFANVWDTVAATTPSAWAQRSAGEGTTWRELQARALSLSTALLDSGLRTNDTVGLYLHNGPSYMESAYGCFKARLQPVNVNYRYGAAELEYLWRDAGLKAVIFHGRFTSVIDSLRTLFPDVHAWIQVDDGSEDLPAWASLYGDVVSSRPRPLEPSTHSGDDQLMIYTGGTTGRPKGVMWAQHDLYCASDTSRDPEFEDLGAVRARLSSSDRAKPIGLSAAPLMHGTGFVFAMSIFSRGGTLISQSSPYFDVVELLSLISRFRVSALCIVGEAFALPMVESLEAEPSRWDVSCLSAVSSSGMAWREETKQRLLRFAPDAMLIDLLNSSEASGMARSVTSVKRSTPTGHFQLGANAFVIDDDGNEIEPGSDVVGRVAVRGYLPLGYHHDPEKTAATFPMVRGVRCSVPGDLARVEKDGTIVLLGRSSSVINRGGEKIFAEEVEEALRTHSAVRDVVVVGVPDSRLGQDVAALVELHPQAMVTPEELVATAKETVASYKVPRKMLFVDQVVRGPNGKVDYQDARAKLEAWMNEDVAHE